MVDAGCETYQAFAKLDKDAQKKACSTFRKDGRVIEISGDYTETLARLKHLQMQSVFWFRFL